MTGDDVNSKGTSEDQWPNSCPPLRLHMCEARNSLLSVIKLNILNKHIHVSLFF